MKNNTYSKFLQFLSRLREAKIAFEIRQSRDDSLMVRINVPGERWEVEFLENGEVEIESFQSGGEIHDETMLEELFAKFSDPEEPKRTPGNLMRHAQ